MWVGRHHIAEHPASQGHTEKRLLDALSWLSETWKIYIYTSKCGDYQWHTQIAVYELCTFEEVSGNHRQRN